MVLKLKGDANLELQLCHNNRKIVVHAIRLKPYFVAAKNAAVFPEHLAPATDLQPLAKPLVQPPLMLTPTVDQHFPDENFFPQVIPPLQPTYAEVAGTRPSPSQRALAPTRANRALHTHLLLKMLPPSTCTWSKSTTTKVMAPAIKPTLFFPQITSDPKPLFQGREGLENKDVNDQEEISINFVDTNNT
jgi:hypothetical protein